MMRNRFKPQPATRAASAVLLLLICCAAPRAAVSQQGKVCSSMPIENRASHAYATGDLLLETGLYKLYGDFGYSNHCWCEFGRAEVSMIYKTDENYRIEDNDDFKRRFEGEILPAINSKCGKVKKVTLRHHVEGHYISEGGEVIEQHQVAGFLQRRSSSRFFGLSYHNFDDDGTVQQQWLFDLGASVSEHKQRRKDAEARRVARAAEKVRLAEAARVETLERKRPLHRAKAAHVLKLLDAPSARNAPAAYDFAGYQQKETLSDIYAGNFKPFTGDYEPEDLEKAVASLNPSQMLNISGLRSPVVMAYVAYHRAFEDDCRSNNELPWQEVSLRRPGTVTRNGFGTVIGRTPAQTFQFFVRQPFADSFGDAFIAINSGDGLAQHMAGISDVGFQKYKSDFKNFLAAEKCSSPAVRHFEVNLYLASKWLLPLQELHVPAGVTKQEPTPQPAAPKPKPRPARARPRGKN